MYRAAVKDAMYPEKSKVYKNLVAITNENKDLVWKTVNDSAYILMVSWKSSTKYYEPYLKWGFYNTGPSYLVWVTTAPELLNRIKKEKPKNLDRRLKQLLGLPPNANYGYFVEFWVKPGDLFRPCLDPEINDKECELCFTENTDSTYMKWIDESRISRYYPCELFNQYPWTALGYTYDWNPQNKSHVGLSEFVIKPNSNVVVEGIYTTEEYFQKGRR